MLCQLAAFDAAHFCKYDLMAGCTSKALHGDKISQSLHRLPHQGGSHTAGMQLRASLYMEKCRNAAAWRSIMHTCSAAHAGDVKCKLQDLYAAGA